MKKQVLATSILILSALPACPQTPGLLSNNQACTVEQLAAGQVVAHSTFTRQTGQPPLEHLYFAVPQDAAVCVVVQSGVPYTNEIAPAALVADLDGEELIGPAPFSAHPTIVSRWVAADELAGGQHDLSIELRGAPASVVTVSIIAVSEQTNIGFGPADPERLLDPSANLTTVRDELMVGAPSGSSRAELQAALQQLPFPAFVVGRSISTPVFQVLIPGLSLSQEGQFFIDQVEALANVSYATLHYASYLQPAQEPFPPVGSDPLYLNHTDGVTSIDDDVAWHLSQINAAGAWSIQKAGSSIGILDIGFNTELADLALAQCTETNCAPPPYKIYACMIDDSCSGDTCPGPDSKMCEENKNCWGEGGGGDSHGNSVAGLAAAQVNLDGAIGVSWSSPLLLDALNWEDGALQKEMGFYQVNAAKVLGPLDRFVTHDTYPARVINLSFGQLKYCPKSGDLVIPDSDERTKYLDATALMISSFLLAHPDVLLVVAAGNEGHKNVASHEAGYAQRLLDPEFYQRRPKIDTRIQSQILSVGASTRPGDVASYTSLGGSPLVAPVGPMYDNMTPLSSNIWGLDWDGNLTRLSGTSFASPQVAGVASLMLAANSKLSSRHVKEILVKTASCSGQSCYLLDAAAAVKQAVRCSQGFSPQGSDDVCPTFQDVQDEDKWYYGPVHRLACDCVLQGYPDGTFKPEQTINRAEALKIVLELAFDRDFDLPDENPFTDVPADKWYAGYAWFASESAIIEFWKEGDTLNPEAAVTRAEFVHLLASAAQLSCVSEGQLNDMEEPVVDEFGELGGAYFLAQAGELPDSPVYSDSHTFGIHEAAIMAASRRCIVSGQGNTDLFDPNSYLNRAEAVKIGCVAIYGAGSAECGNIKDGCLLYTASDEVLIEACSLN